MTDDDLRTRCDLAWRDPLRADRETRPAPACDCGLVRAWEVLR